MSDKEFHEIVKEVKSNWLPSFILVQDPAERAASYKILKSLAKLSPEARQALANSMAKGGKIIKLL